jgi:hypothetical protein
MCVELLCLYPGSILDTKVAQTMVQINIDAIDWAIHIGVGG